MIGWSAASGRLDLGRVESLAILFFWQLPHFFAIAWMYREDYARAGFQMVSSGRKRGTEREPERFLLYCSPSRERDPGIPRRC